MAGAFQSSAFQGSAFQTDEQPAATTGGGGAFVIPSDFVKPLRKKALPVREPDQEIIPPVFGTGFTFTRRPKATGRGLTGSAGRGVALLNRRPFALGKANHFDSVAADNAVILLSF